MDYDTQWGKIHIDGAKYVSTHLTSTVTFLHLSPIKAIITRGQRPLTRNEEMRLGEKKK